MTKRSKWQVIAGVSAALGLGAYFAGNTFMGKNKEEQYPVFEGSIVREDLFEPAPGFGLIYRIEVRRSNSPDSRNVPFVVVGNERELRDMDQQFNVGDHVKVKRDTNMFSLDLEAVLTSECIKKTKE